MTKKQLVTVLTLSGIAAALSCDSGPSATNGDATSAATPDCPIGTFRPEGIADCVFPADDQNGNPLGVSDNRCALGQPAAPPVCVSDSGERSYLAATPTCAPSYHYEPGACERGGGIGGSFTTADAAFAVVGGEAGVVGGEAGVVGGEAGVVGGAAGSADAIVSPADASTEATPIE